MSTSRDLPASGTAGFARSAGQREETRSGASTETVPDSTWRCSGTSSRAPGVETIRSPSSCPAEESPEDGGSKPGAASGRRSTRPSATALPRPDSPRSSAHTSFGGASWPCELPLRETWTRALGQRMPAARAAARRRGHPRTPDTWTGSTPRPSAAPQVDVRKWFAAGTLVAEECHHPNPVRQTQPAEGMGNVLARSPTRPRPAGCGPWLARASRSITSHRQWMDAADLESARWHLRPFPRRWPKPPRPRAAARTESARSRKPRFACSTSAALRLCDGRQSGLWSREGLEVPGRASACRRRSAPSRLQEHDSPRPDYSVSISPSPSDTSASLRSYLAFEHGNPFQYRSRRRSTTSAPTTSTRSPAVSRSWAPAHPPSAARDTRNLQRSRNRPRRDQGPARNVNNQKHGRIRTSTCPLRRE